MSATEKQQRESAIPADVGLPAGEPAEQPDRTPDELVNASAAGKPLSPGENDDLVAYFLAHDSLPGDKQVHHLTVKTGDGASSKEFPCAVHTIEWSEWQESLEKATNDKTGRMDTYVSASWIVARALVEPKLGPAVMRLQQSDPEHAPADAAELLRRMFRKQPGSLLELSALVLEKSKLSNETQSVKEVESAKN